MSSSDQELKQIEIDLYRYTTYLRNLVLDLKKRNHPLGKKYYKIPNVRWSKFHKWYSIDRFTDTKEKIDWDRLLYVAHNDLKQDDFYKKMNERINKISKNEDKFLFGAFVEKALFVFCYEHDTKFFNVKNLVKYLINSIKDELPIIKTTSYLSGIMIEQNEIIVNKYLRIRKANKKDFEIEVKPEEWDDYNEVVEQCFCILEFTYKQDLKYDHSFETLKKIELILTLFKLSSPDCIGISNKSSNIERTFHGTYRLGFYHDPGLQYYARIKENEIEYLKLFYGVMEKRLTRSIVNHYREDNELEISLSRYMNGLKSIHLIRISVSYAVMAIEALLIKSEGDQKLRFALNSSKLLGLIGLDSKKVYDDMLTAYDVRSKYVHGDKMSNKTEKAIKKRFKNKDEFGFLMMDYARIIIATYVILNKTKDELYIMLENAQFQQGSEKLENKIKIVKNYLKMDKYKPIFKMWPKNRHYITE